MFMFISHRAGSNENSEWDCPIRTTLLVLILVMCATEDTASQTASRCTDQQFACKDHQCIAKQWLCDSNCNCVGCDDESASICNRTCNTSEFTCGNGQCIDLAWKCDGQRDCASGADESNKECSDRKTCSQHEFQCDDGKQCISRLWMCDGDTDCSDGSDESAAHCSTSATPHAESCAADHFPCSDGLKCVPRRWLCDGDRDCKDGSDETSGCVLRPTTPRVSLPCTEYEFACKSGRCVMETSRCDTVSDCSDGSDEENCPPKECEPSQFRCRSLHQCIPSRMRCDATVECLDGSDEEGCSVLSISIPRSCNASNSCDHVCTSDDSGAMRCSCYSGYTLAANKVSCIDVDECSMPYASNCSQTCINTNGSYACGCVDGYAPVHFNNKSCKALGDRPHLVFSNRIDVRQLLLAASHEYTVVVDEGKSIVALDIDNAAGLLYYSDVNEEKILRAQLPTTESTSAEIETQFIANDVKTVDGLAYDWIYRRIYWTDTATKTVSAASVDNAADRTVLITDLAEPRAIAVYPNKGLMFFSDWGRSVIVRSGMDGDHVFSIITNMTIWPNGITIDYTSESLFWIDAKLYCIQTSNFDGKHQRLIVENTDAIRHPFAITVFEDSLYWSEWTPQRIMTANKVTGADVAVVLNNTLSHGQPMDVKVRHPLRQPSGINECKRTSLSPCPQLCFPAPQWPGIKVSLNVTCRCRIGYTLDSNKITCRPVGGADLAESSTQNAVISSAIGGQSSQLPTGVIAGITMGIFVVVFFALGVAGWRLHHHCAKINERTVNFDNPVYVKTTEDKLDLKYHEQRPSKTTPPVLQPLTSSDALTMQDEYDA